MENLVPDLMDSSVATILNEKIISTKELVWILHCTKVLTDVGGAS